MEAGGHTDYPLQYSVEYPDRELNRLTTAFRIFVAIPILIVIASIEGVGSADWGGGGDALPAVSSGR